jgi:hypothetical protein
MIDARLFWAAALIAVALFWLALAAACARTLEAIR